MGQVNHCRVNRGAQNPSQESHPSKGKYSGFSILLSHSRKLAKSSFIDNKEGTCADERVGPSRSSATTRQNSR
jgi:hypothetical protein